jgi:hypothetical protein
VTRAVHGAAALPSMISKSGNRFSEKVMIRRKICDHDPIHLDRIMAR